MRIKNRCLRVLERGFASIFVCLQEAVSDAVSEVFGINKEDVKKYFEEKRLKISKTPDPSVGDYGVALHFLLHKNKVPRQEWDNIGNSLIKFMKEKGYMNKCFVKNAVFVNGYLNFYIDYIELFKQIVDGVLAGKIKSYLESIGNGEKVIVEHTSANPIHPLHIGSGRNAVIGNTYARLLSYLGFNVREHFYVNDMGRQVAVLVYGYNIVKKNGIKPPTNIKIDHWMGAIYALTNILIQKQKLRKEIKNIEDELEKELTTLHEKTINELYKIDLYSLIELFETTKNLLKKFNYKHDLGEVLSEITNTLEKVEKELTSKGYSKVWKELKNSYDKIRELRRKYNELFSELSNYTASEDKLSSIYPEIYAVLSREITDPELANETIREYMRRYENGDEEIGKLFREVSAMTLEGFKETLGKLGIWFDSFDWESSHKIRSLARKVIEDVEKLPYARREEGALLLDLDQASIEHKFISELFGKDKPGKFIIQRSDGTSLYTTRDVAYSIYKFKEYGAKRVYNVIAVEQTREQKQVKATLYLLGYKDEAEKLIHFVYEMVNLKGMRMSSRRGQYYSLDELIEDYKKVMARTYVENQKRKYKSIESPEKLDIEKLDETFYKLAVASSRALLLSIDPSKVLTFDPRKLEEYGLGSWIIYTFVRIQGILRKAFDYEPLDNMEKIRIDGLKSYEEIANELKDIDPVEKELLETIQEYPSTLLEAYKYLKPNKLVEYANNLCMALNKLYESLPVLGERDHVKRNARIVIVLLSFIILKDLLEIMGFPLIKRI